MQQGAASNFLCETEGILSSKFTISDWVVPIVNSKKYEKKLFLIFIITLSISLTHGEQFGCFYFP